MNVHPRRKSVIKASSLMLCVTAVVAYSWFTKAQMRRQVAEARAISPPEIRLNNDLVSGTKSLALPKDVSKQWFAEVKRNIEASEYEIRWQDHVEAYQSPNRGQGLRFTYLTDGFLAEPRIYENKPDWQVGIRLLALKRSEMSIPFRPGKVEANGNKAEARSDVCRIQYENDSAGMRQNFVLEKRPAGKGELELEFSVNLEGTQMEVGSARDSVSFMRDESGGAEVMRYSDLKVFDANHKVVLAQMIKRSDKSFSIVVNDQDAEYPLLIDPLSTSANWNTEGNQNYMGFGWTVASAGDVNGDGYSDVMVGAPGFDCLTGDEGKVFVYHGSASGLSTTADWWAEGTTSGDEWGWAISTAGDVNGDGYSDIIIGTPLRDGATYYDSGAVYAWYGSSSGLGSSGTPSNADWKIYADNGLTNAAHYMHFGYSVSTAGDVNGDGYSDVVIGAPFDTWASGTQHIFVYHGSAWGLESGYRYDYGFGQNYAMWGFAVALAGDINGDGYSDIIASAPYYDNGHTDEGIAVALAGSSSGVSTTLWSGEGNQTGAAFGYSLSTAGDVTGDGYSDVIIGAPYYDNGQTDEGMVFVHRGSSGLPYLSTSPWQAQSDQAYALMGLSVGYAGDVNGDGYSDIIVGAPYYDNGQTDEGKVFVWYGGGSYYTGLGVHATPTNADWSVESDQAYAYMGMSVATAGDVSGDGYSDVIIGAYAYDNGQTDEGRAYVYHGSSAGVSPTSAWSIAGSQDAADYGISVASAGDVNGDGYSDVIVGAWAFDNGESNEGRAYVYHGSVTGAVATASWTAEANQASAQLGVSVASAGDVNGDGYGDIIVGANGYSNGQSVEGAAFVWLGSSTGLGSNGTPANADWLAESDQVGYTHFGYSVSSAGDVNGDGYDDIVIGAYEYSNGTSREGAVFVWHGSSTGLGSNGNPGNADWTADSNQSGVPLFGISVAEAGDVNGDGYGDVIVGSPAYNDGSEEDGRAFVWLGSSTGLCATPWYAEGNQAACYFGRSVAGAGDVNGDGYSDILIGSPLYSNGQNTEGRAFAFYGGSSGLGSSGNPSNADWSVESNQADGNLGSRVASAGDVNGDGYSDVLIGGERYDNGSLTNAGIVAVYHGGSSGLAATADLTLGGPQTGARLSLGLASAGDVNGDGYSDIIVSAPYYNNDGISYTEGRAWLYYGNLEEGLDVKPRQWRTNLTTPVQPGLLTGSSTQAGVGLYARSALGRGDVKMQYEVKSAGTAFNGSSLDTTASWSDSGTAGVAINTVKSGLSSGTQYKWRSRIKYRLSEGLVQPYGRWIYPPLNAPTEIDFRTN